jgi:hypothetical protein
MVSDELLVVNENFVIDITNHGSITKETRGIGQ